MNYKRMWDKLIRILCEGKGADHWRGVIAEIEGDENRRHFWCPACRAWIREQVKEPA
jgi:hypothetical protein